jgi:hypothetical protein
MISSPNIFTLADNFNLMELTIFTFNRINNNKMSKQTDIKIFEDKKVRTLWDAQHEKWYLSIVDIVAVLTDSPNPQVYWRVLKKRLKDEGNESVTSCNALKSLPLTGK